MEEHRNDEGFSEDCRKEIERTIELRVGDFRLDSIMRQHCRNDVELLCAYQKETLDTGTDLDARVVLCLQDFRDEIEDAACQKRVRRYIELASEDIRFNVPLAEACYDDRVQLCNNVAPGSARVIRCLQSRCGVEYTGETHCPVWLVVCWAAPHRPTPQPREAVVRLQGCAV